jgi:hypothetical protein
MPMNTQQYQQVQSYAGEASQAYNPDTFISDDQPATNTICIDHLTWVHDT